MGRPTAARTGAEALKGWEMVFCKYFCITSSELRVDVLNAFSSSLCAGLYRLPLHLGSTSDSWAVQKLIATIARDP